MDSGCFDLRTDSFTLWIDGKDSIILTNESQRDVRVLEWRPNGGRMLAVGCKWGSVFVHGFTVSIAGSLCLLFNGLGFTCRNGICIWSASYPGNAASARSGTISFVGSLSRGSWIRYLLVDFLRSQNDEHVSALTWSPDGRYPYKCQIDLFYFTICFSNMNIIHTFFCKRCLCMTVHFSPQYIYRQC
jgi:aladin